MVSLLFSYPAMIVNAATNANVNAAHKTLPTTTSNISFIVLLLVVPLVEHSIDIFFNLYPHEVTLFNVLRINTHDGILKTLAHILQLRVIVYIEVAQ
jgi:hypothetical protein